jgi:hypothetical protein
VETKGLMWFDHEDLCPRKEALDGYMYIISFLCYNEPRGGGR